MGGGGGGGGYFCVQKLEIPGRRRGLREIPPMVGYGGVRVSVGHGCLTGCLTGLIRTITES